MVRGLPERLRTLRVNNALSQRAVAKKLGVSPALISGYETGERTPSLEMLLSLSHLYHCSTDYLLGKNVNDCESILVTEGLSHKQLNILRELIGEMKNKG